MNYDELPPKKTASFDETPSRYPSFPQFPLHSLNFPDFPQISFNFPPRSLNFPALPQTTPNSLTFPREIPKCTDVHPVTAANFPEDPRFDATFLESSQNYRHASIFRSSPLPELTWILLEFPEFPWNLFGFYRILMEFRKMSLWRFCPNNSSFSYSSCSLKWQSPK